MGIPVGYEAWVSRSAKITVPYRCAACGHPDTALVAGMGSGIGGGRGYGRDAAMGLANVAAGQVIEQDARRIAAAIKCPKCGMGGVTVKTLHHPRITQIERQTMLIYVALLVFCGPGLLAGTWGAIVSLALMGGVGYWAWQRRDKAREGREAFVRLALADAAVWSVAPERFPQREQSVF
jgi:predicted RNA-binding Zn-ribbon protein involved in translation (DUF1610 family)